MQDKTLMFYINTIWGGGAERAIVQVANYMSKNGYKVILVTSFRGPNEYRLENDVIRISMENQEKKSSRLVRNCRRIALLRKLCRQYSPQCLISFMAEPNFRAMIATMGLPIKNIISVRNNPNKEYAGKVNAFLARHLLSRAEGCVFQTEDAKEWFPKSLQNKSEVIFNAVDPAFFTTPRTGKDKGFVTFGRLSSQKNHAMLIRAFASVVKQYPQERLYIYGDGDEKQNLERIISELGVQENVALMGPTTNVVGILAEAKAFVLSSDYEGMPNALMEALAMGLPCIATDCPCGGPRALINEGVNGLLVPVDGEKKMSEALELVIKDGKFTRRIGEQAKMLAQEFEPEMILKHWKNYIVKTATSANAS